MKNIFIIFIYTMKRYIRDKGSLAEMLLLPVVLIFILGNALNGIFEPAKITKIPTVYLNLDKREASRPFEEFLESSEVKRYLDITEIDDFETGEKMLSDRRAYVMIYVDESFTQNIASGEKAYITLYNKGTNEINLTIAKNLIEGFTSGANAVAAMHSVTGEYMEYNYAPGITDNSFSASGNIPRAVDYYAVTMLIMTIMYGSLYAADSTTEDYMGNMGNRLRTTPIRASAIYTGKTLANILITYLQAIIVVLFSMFAFKVNWGTDITFLLLILLLFTFLSSGIGTVLGILLKKRELASGTLNILIIFFTFIAGGYFKFSDGGPVINALRHLSPSYLAQTAVFNLIYKGTYSLTLRYMFIIAVFTIVVYLTAALAGRRKSI